MNDKHGITRPGVADCLLCNVDARCADQDERAACYLMLADVAVVIQKVPWHEYVDPCRKHMMMLPRGLKAVADVFEYAGGPSMSDSYKRMAAKLEVEIQAQYDELEDEAASGREA